MTKRILKLAGIFIGTIAVLIIVAGFLFRIYSPKYFIPFVIDKVHEKTNGRYALSINSDSVKVHLLSMSLNLGSTEFRRDSTVSEYSGIPFLDKFDVRATFDAFELSAFQLTKFLVRKRIIVDQIILEHPSIVIRKNISYNPDNAAKSEERSIVANSINYEADSVLADTLAIQEFHNSRDAFTPYMRVNDFQINGGSFKLFDGRKKYPIQEVYGLDFQLTKFISHENHDREVEDAFIHLDSASSLVSKNIARLKVKGVNIHPDTIEIDQLLFGHIVDRYQINKIRGFRASWLNIDVNDIDIHGIHTAKLISDSILNIDKASIGYVKLYLFKDKEEAVINPAHKPLPSEQIRQIPMPILVDTFQIKDGDIIVDMEAAQAISPGRITLNNLKTDILNLTNDKNVLNDEPEMKVHAEFAIMDSAKIKYDAAFTVNSPEDDYHVECSVSPFNASILNGFLGSQFFIEFSSGEIKGLKFSFDGNDKANVGTMDLEYENLKVRKLKEYDRYLEGKPNTGFIAGVGNMLIPHNRSKENKQYKSAVIYYEKEYNRDVIHCNIMSIISGVESSLGLLTKNLDKRQSQADDLSEEDVEKSAEKANQKVEKAEKKKAKKDKN